MAIEVGKNSEAAIVCAKNDWRRFLADIAFMFNIKIVWDSEISPIVSKSTFEYTFYLTLEYYFVVG